MSEYGNENTGNSPVAASPTTEPAAGTADESRREWDVIMVGGGVAGLSAALMLGRARRRVLVVDAGEPRNRFATHMHGVLGFEGQDPAELLRKGRSEANRYGITVRRGRVERVAEAADGLVVTVSDGTHEATRALIAAAGATDLLPDVAGLAEQWGNGVLHCPYCHGWEVGDQRLAVLGTSPQSVHQAELVRQWSDQVTFFTAACGALTEDVMARLQSRNVELVDTPVTGIRSELGRLTGVALADGTSRDFDAVFTTPTMCPHDGFLADLRLARHEAHDGGFLDVDQAGKTSHPRVWAVGNIVDPRLNVPMSLGAGAGTGSAVNMALVSEEFERAAAAHYWEGEYADRPRRWSGAVNPAMAQVVQNLPVPPGGRALDLGCGEGGDAVWLAEHGWQVTAVDISATATARGVAAAGERGLGGRISWVQHDLATWQTTEAFDLVTATYFHSTFDLPRAEILRRAAARVRPGGHLLIISHVFEEPADIPPWSLRFHDTNNADDPAQKRSLSTFLTPAQEVAALGLDGSGDGATDEDAGSGANERIARWETVIQETRPRTATGPNGHEMATVKDGVVLLRLAPGGHGAV